MGEEEELRKAHEELESRIETRTAELAKANKQLYHKVAESKHAEEEIRKLNETLELRIAERTSELERRNREIREMAQKTMRAMENDRRVLAKEIHDSIGGTLSAIMYQLESRVENVGPAPPSIEFPLEKIIFHLRDVVQESRRITKQLQPSVLDDFGLVAAMEEYLGDFQQFYPKTKVQKIISITVEDLSIGAKTVLYRVLQEALNNIGKHSRADQVDIQCYRDNTRVTLKIQDKGIGFNATEVIRSANVLNGYGLHSMKERVELCHGSLRIESAPGKGTTLIASIPL